MGKKIYIFIPADTCSGGPEALHQLAYYMDKCNLHVYVIYYDNGFVNAQPLDRYVQYKPNVITFQDIEDDSQNICIAPENAPWCLNNVHKAKRCIWWLGVGANEMKYPSIKQRLVYLKRKLQHLSLENARFILYNDSKCIHLCGSKYAYEYTRDRYPNSMVRYLVEPISMDFLDMKNTSFMDCKCRTNIVLYNPAKPSELMTQLLSRRKFEYVPLRNLTPKQLVKKYNEAKLYVDFGKFDGPERMPKEAVYFGCNILVANHNAASNDFDVAIPNFYKVNTLETVEQLERRIEDMLINYDKHLPNFESFRKKIECLEIKFMKQITEIFIDGFN